MHKEPQAPPAVSDNAEEGGWNPNFFTTSEDTARTALGDFFVFATMSRLWPREHCVNVDLEGGERVETYML